RSSIRFRCGRSTRPRLPSRPASLKLLRSYRIPPRSGAAPQQMMMVWGVEPALGTHSVAESPADQHQGGTGDAGLFHFVADVGESAADQAFVRPADPLGADDGTIPAVMRRNGSHYPRDMADATSY